MFDNRAVNETVAFVLVFSMVLTSVGLVYTFGFDTITEVRDAEQLTNAERTFRTLERNFDDIRRREAPSRSAEMSLGGGSLRIRSGSRIVLNVSTASGWYNRSIELRALSYRYRNRWIEYENGAVFRRTPRTSVVLSRPSLRCVDGDGDGQPDYAILSIVTMNGSGTEISGDSIATIQSTLRSSNLLFPTDRSDLGRSVNVSMVGPNAAGWTQYLTSAPGWEQAADGTFYCDAPGGLDRVYVRRTILHIVIA